ncbi:MAG: YggT family protein [Sphingomonadaceae bacterium]|nr:YggT family protein [Sphingomonadaceae bacterium]
MLDSVLSIVAWLCTILIWIVIIQAVLSLLVAFNVINTYNDFVRQLVYALDRITEPLYRPIRRILPDFGGIDFSPFVVIILLNIVIMLIRGLQTELLVT